MFPLRPSGKRPYIIGHRGARAYAPENTLASFRKGHECGADLIECDVHLSRDRKLVVIHDESVDRTTNGRGCVRELELADLRALDAGQGERIPTLEELLDWVRAQLGLGIAVEIKENLAVYPGISEAVVNALVARELVDRAIVISFDYGAIHEAKDLCRDLATGLLFGREIPDPIGSAREAHADSLWPSVRILTPGLAALAHTNGLALYTWTANEPEDLRRAIACGADGIGSDYPDRVIEARGQSR